MIDLDTLYLDGWLSYDKATIPLNSSGVTLIKGNIGSGKSAILEAIFYLLFGKTIRGKDSLNSLPNKILNNGYEIALDFRVDSNQCSIKEIRNRENKGLYFVKNGKSVEGDARKAITDTLGMTAQEFEAIAFLGQKQAQVLVEGTPGERAKAIVSIFGLSKYDAALKTCTESIKQNADRIGHQNETIETISREVQNLEKMLQSAKEISPTATKQKKERLEKVSVAIAACEAKIKKLHQLMEENKHILGQAEVISLQAKKAKLVELEIAELKDELACRTWPKQGIDQLREGLNTLNQERAKCSVTITHNQSEIERVNRYQNHCPINREPCPVDIPKTYKSELIAKCKDKLAEAKIAMQKIEDNIVTKTEQLHSADNRLCLERTLFSKKNTLKRLAIDETPNTKKAGKCLKKCREALTIGNAKLNDLQEEFTDIKIELSTYEKAKSFKKTVTDSIDERKQELAVQKDTLQKLDTNAKYLAACLSVLKKTKMYKIDLVIKLLNEYLNDILNQISNGEYKAQFVSQQADAKGDRILDKIGILVSDSYKSIPVELCSGGQRDEVGLSVLLATWKAAYKLSNKSVSSLWLDEVFGALDQDTVDRVFEAVIEVATGLGARTVKIISHRDLDARLFDHIWQINIIDGVSRIEIV